MPIYEYVCDDCQRRFEILQRMGEGPEGLACPRCGGTKLGKVFSTFAASTSSGASAGGDCAGPGPSGECRAPSGGFG